MIEIKQFTGKVDYDSPNEVIEAGSARAARNVEWFGNLPDLRPQVVQGNMLLINSLLPNTGVNLTIGRHYDAVKHRLIFFNYNSAGTHGIYIFYTLTGQFVRLIQNGVNTAGDVLGFNPFVRIHSIDIIYGDDTDGDLLFFVDGNNNCRKLNIERLLLGTAYNLGILSNYLYVIKPPPSPPIKCTYENDSTVSSNNLVNSLFTFCCTFIYDDFEQSVLGSGSMQPLPSDPFNPQNNTPASRNARIALYLPTGDQSVTKIRIYAKQTQYNATTDWFIVDTLDKTLLNIPSFTVFRYLFFNNGNYIAADPSFTQLDYDYTPSSANTQTLLNGNVLAYGGIKEGYNFINPTFQILTANVTPPAYSLNGTLFFGSTNGIFSLGSQIQVSVYLTGVGVNDGFGNANTLEKAPAFLVVRAKSNSTDISFNYANSGGITNITTLLTNLKAAAIAAGWVFVSQGTNVLTIYYPTGSIVFETAFLSGISANTSPYPSPVSSHFPQSSYSYGLLYRDAFGRTNGVISNVSGNVVTQAIASDGQISQITINLASFTPPSWASYYEIVRTDTLTYQKYLDWISAGAYQGTANGGSTTYGYFDVSNITSYNQEINATEGVISYSFSPGDRIKILGRYDSTGAFTSLNLDYAILGAPTLVTANGIQRAGQFIQIYYPTNDIGPNFQFSTTTNDTNFQNYKILIYSYKAYLPTNENVYYQIGQQYQIGNPGSPSAYHEGNIADNTIVLTDGDVFFRQRTIPLVSTYYINIGGFDQQTTYSTIWVNPGGGGIPIVDNGIWSIVGDTHKVAGITNTTYPLSTDTGWTIRNETTTETLSVRLSGTQPVVDKTDPNGQFAMYVKVVLPGNVVQLTQILPLQTGLQAGVSNNYTFDQTISLPPQGKLWIINYAANEMLIGGFLLTLQVIRNLTINVFDASFSDIYAIKTNADNKPNVVNVDAKTTYFTTLFRYSEAYQAGTNINNTNRFYPQNFDEFPKQWGSIQRLYAWGNKLRVFQERKIGEVGVYAQFVLTNTGAVSFVKNESIITPNNIQYYEEDFGIGDQPSSLISSGFQNFLADPVRGAYIRVSLDGVKNISEEHNFQTFSGANLPNYLNDYTYQFGGNASLVGCFNFKKNKDGEVLFVLQGGTGALGTIPGQTLAFNERKTSVTAVYDINPDDIVCCENQLYSFYNGNLWIHNNISNNGYANFFGTAYPVSVTMVFNEQKTIKKNFQAIAYQSYMNKAWAAVAIGDIITSTFDANTKLQQMSQLPAANFSNEESSISAAFKNDSNSGPNQLAGLNSGSYLQGWWLQIVLTAPDNNFNFLYLPLLRYANLDKTP